MTQPTGPNQACDQCGDIFSPSPRGRRRRFCTAKCRSAAYRKAKTPPQEPPPSVDPMVIQIAGGLMASARHLQNVAKSAEPALGNFAELRIAAEIGKEYDELLNAVVYQARLRKVRWPAIAEILGVSTETARTRWEEGKVTRILTRRRERGRKTARPRGSGARERGSRNRRSAAITLDAQARLASALSHLQRASGRYMREIAKEAGVSTSYISRAVSGERMPRWDVVASFAQSCGADPVQLRVLWEEANGKRTVQPFFAGRPKARPDALFQLASGIQGLYLAAGRPSPQLIAERASCHLTPARIDAILSGQELSSWPDIATVVKALQGPPEVIRPLWECLQLAANPEWTPENPLPPTPASQTQATTLRAESF
ncbi:helix-turn-helix transcriptional regulator [Streptomyces sp. BE20]|uniref:helix-turn-helix domain-containing protein n=1 Tax=Streptomyces sp. BE20 TaxID=3002525 RepID=UPI002E79906A|nr:helix-turn-helix transcriptional regulator [Streptomyces sp. BE20]MEE1822203.1 helix-turn-helix transcriptional regulator [Streptomyces sp. BE20]